MLRKVLWLVPVVLLLVAFRAPLRQGEGGRTGKGVIFEETGKKGAAGRWIERSLRDQYLGKRVHFVRGKHSYSGKVTNVKVQPTSGNERRLVRVTVETMASMGDRLETAEGEAREDRGNSATINLNQISGVMLDEAHPYVGAWIEVSYDDIRPQILPSDPAGMFRRGAPNLIVAYYSDGYLEVDVTGILVGTNPGTATMSGTVFIHAEDIVRDEGLNIVYR